MNIVVFNNSVCIFATPFTNFEPTIDKLAILTFFVPSSSTIESALNFPQLFGYFYYTFSKNKKLIKYMISKCLGSNFSIKGTPHFSNASGNTVWFV